MPLTIQAGSPPNILLAKDIAFITEEELITIQCTAKIGTLHLMSNDYGPLLPNRQCQVPMWVARQLKRASLCRVVPPAWLSLETLNNFLEREEANPDDFQALPFHYLEMATELLDWAVEDIPQSEKVRLTIQCIREKREMKMQQGLPSIDGNPLKLNNVGHFELNTIRPFIVGTLDLFSKIRAAEIEGLSHKAIPYTLPITSIADNTVPYDTLPLDFTELNS